LPVDSLFTISQASAAAIARCAAVRFRRMTFNDTTTERPPRISNGDGLESR
jgi:hypothetical protein